jgi:oligopeptide/dipeptide ABC transporter ATP-binding protein
MTGLPPNGQALPAGAGGGPPGLDVEVEPPAATATWRRVVRRLAHQPASILAGAYLALVIVAAVFAGALAPMDPREADFAHVLEGPSATHLLGTDDLGRDVLSRLIYGTRVALQVSVGAVAIAMLIGVPAGLIIGYRGRWTDRLGTRVLDIFDSLPGLIIAFAVITTLGRGLTSTTIAIGLVFTVRFARLARATTLAERDQLYVDAARVAGLRTPNILLKQLLPNLAGPLIVQAAVCLGLAILIESLISFVGLGLDPAEPSWGGMLSLATDEQARQPFLPFPPGIAIILTVLAFNLVGDGLRDALGSERRVRAAGGRRRAKHPDGRAQQAPRRAESVVPVAADPDAVLEIRGLAVDVSNPEGRRVDVIDDLDLRIGRGEVVGLVGESGCGKSMLARAAIGLLPVSARIARGSVQLDGSELVGRGERDLQRIRGTQMAMIFQDPLRALSPVHTVGTQLCEPLRIHRGMSKNAARKHAIEMLTRVGVPQPARRLDDYPHQFSGGMAQRVAIAMALSLRPKLLIADEPTTALDVTTQSQVLDLLLDLRDEIGMAILLITHDLGVVAEVCERAAVMYAGEIVEVNAVADLLERPRHPYTAAMLAANPGNARRSGRLVTIPGRVPPAGEWPGGCRFRLRCSFATDDCLGDVALVEDVRCVRADDLRTAVAR